MTEREAGPIASARCWLHANEPERAVEEGETDYPDLLQACMETCTTKRRPAIDEFLLARELIALSDRVIVKDRGACFRVAIARLRWDSGLSDYEALPDSADRLSDSQPRKLATTQHCGDFTTAVEKIDRNIEYREQFGMRGLNLGWAYDARATLALRMRDRPNFERAIQHCALNYSGGRDNPALAARYEQLLQEARSVWQEGDRNSLPLARAYELTTSRLVSALDHDSRAQVALESLLAAAHCESGQLFLLREGGLVLAAGEGATMQQRTVAKQLVATAMSDDCDVTADEADDDSAMQTARDAAEFKTVLLTCPSAKRLATVGALSLVGEPEIPAEFYEVMRVVCQALIDTGEVQASVR